MAAADESRTLRQRQTRRRESRGALEPGAQVRWIEIQRPPLGRGTERHQADITVH